jgi:lipopolysaccharide/colanic/teichoic acid biosynthesis glycosyltransferase
MMLGVVNVGRGVDTYRLTLNGKVPLRERAACARGSVLKRLLDIAGALIGLLLLAPFLFLVAVLIRLESPGPAVFKQRRTGLSGNPFSIYKFRTMTVVEDGDAVVQAKPGDCRVTRLGKFLRRSCIDELPQLWNVLIGDMSLIGPRPHAVAHDTFYRHVIPDYDNRFLVRPGMAGLAQVKGFRGPTEWQEDMATRVALDLEYIRSWTFGSDVRLLLEAIVCGPFHERAL